MVALFTYGLNSANCHLMPWRTIIEVARIWADNGKQLLIVTDGQDKQEWAFDGIRILQISGLHTIKGKGLLKEYLEANNINRLYFPVAPGSRIKEILDINKTNHTEVTWYFPGSWYYFKQLIVSTWFLSFRQVIPYWYQVLYPKKVWIKTLLSNGPKHIITNTQFTAREIIKHGYPAKFVVSIYPGKTPIHKNDNSIMAEMQNKIQVSKDEPYFLFFGPASPIRGVLQLLSAFKKYCNKTSKGNLVLLFRPDGNVNSKYVKTKIKKFPFPDRLKIRWDTVRAEELGQYIKNCRAVIKPFLLVPSEVPLAIIEAATYSKPVLGFNTGGTGIFISKCGVAVRYADTIQLSKEMLKIAEDNTYYEALCTKAHKTIIEHPTWRNVAELWETV